MSTPKVSVCVVTYNQVQYIEACVRSVLGQQTKHSFEIIVGDDGSTDGTTEVLSQLSAEFPDTLHLLFFTDNLGPGPNYLRTHAAATGEYICHMDGDDLALPGKLEAQVKILDSYPKANVVMHEMLHLTADGQLSRVEPVSGGASLRMFTLGDLLATTNIGAHSSEMYRSIMRIDDAGPLPDVLDLYAVGRHINKGNAILLTEPLGVYRPGAGIMATQAKKVRGLQVQSMEVFAQENPSLRPYVCCGALNLLRLDRKDPSLRLLPIPLVWRYFSLRGVLIFMHQMVARIKRRL